MRSGKQHQCSSTEIEMDGNHLYDVIPSRKDDTLEQEQHEVEATCMFGLSIFHYSLLFISGLVDRAMIFCRERELQNDEMFNCLGIQLFSL